MLLLVRLVILLGRDAVNLQVVPGCIRKSIAARRHVLSFANLANSSRGRSRMIMMWLHAIVITSTVMMSNEFLLRVIVHHTDLCQIHSFLLAQQVGAGLHITDSLHAANDVLTNKGTWTWLTNPVTQDTRLTLARAPWNLLITIGVLLIRLLAIALKARRERIPYGRTTAVVSRIVRLSVAVLVIGNTVR